MLAKICLSLLLVLVSLLTIETCQRTNRRVHACLNTYIERDFSLIEELVKRPPQDKQGHILIEEDDLTQMCNRLNELIVCYEHMMFGCVSYVEYAHMRRVVTTMKTINASLCNASSYLIRNLILGGYCLEYTRGQSQCSKSANADKKLSSDQEWPLTLVSILRFNISVVNMCPYLQRYNQCVFPYIEKHCHKTSVVLWNTTFQAIDKNWCQG